MQAGIRDSLNLNPGVLALLGGALAGGREDLAKAFAQPNSQTVGFVWYNLEAPPRELYPRITPIRNRVPRNGNGLGTASNWKAVTAVNSGNMQGGTSDGNRGGAIATTLTEYTAPYRTLGFEDYVTFQANWSAKQLADLRPLARRGLMNALMIFEEQVDLGGNTSQALGTTPTPTTALVAGGALTAQATNVICIALTLQGYLSASVSGGVVVGPIARTNADASSDSFGSGAARKSAASAQTTAGGNLSISAVVAPVRGAFAYAWFVGASGSELLHSITTINSQLFTANSTGTQNASAHPASDQSTNALVYDGLLTQLIGTSALTSYSTVGSTCTLYRSTAGSIVGIMANGTLGTGTPLTADGKGGIVEIDATLKAMWDTARLTPQIMFISSQEAQNIQQKILAGSSNPAFRFNLTADQSGLVGGMATSGYLNKFATGGPALIEIQIHPFCPAGTILFYTDTLNYQVGGIPSVIEKECRNDYFQLEWPLRSLKYEYGIYMDGLLKNRFPPAFAMLTNIGNG